jgi:NDP-sugar pyrophosphorylase family protein
VLLHTIAGFDHNTACRNILHVQKFRPFSDEVPEALLPFVKMSRIEYALEWLASSGVERVFVLCCAQTLLAMKSKQCNRTMLRVQKFRPVSDGVPKALLPLVNSPMIEYALEWLASNGVEKVYVLCCAHADKIVAYLDNSLKWAPDRCSMEIQTIINYHCRSAGEALRFIDHEGLIQDDFVLLSCDSITNMSLGGALAAHRQRRCVSLPSEVVAKEGD